MTRDKIFSDSWSIQAALARGFSDRYFERGEGPGDEVGEVPNRHVYLYTATTDHPLSRAGSLAAITFTFSSIFGWWRGGTGMLGGGGGVKSRILQHYTTSNDNFGICRTLFF